ncbi:DNA-binding transcriptional LysR family regulator [Xanthomonas arboricola]|nr:DNA-binding transcriptional LysR family regulator [Xanthomonas arboricola]
MTPSAISQRVKALEDRLGQVLVIRKAPCRPTPAGERLLRRVKPMQVLESEAIADFLPGDSSAGHPRTLAIAVNDDSLQTWFLAALSALHREHGVLFDVQMDDQDHTLELLRSGAVLGAVTAERKPLQGCNVQALGVMRYNAIASAAFVATHFKQGFSAAALAHAPMLVFKPKGHAADALRPPHHPHAGDAADPLPADLDRFRGSGSTRTRLVSSAGIDGRACRARQAGGHHRPGTLARCAAVLAMRRGAIEHLAAARPGPAQGRGCKPALRPAVPHRRRQKHDVRGAQLPAGCRTGLACRYIAALPAHAWHSRVARHPAAAAATAGSPCHAEPASLSAYSVVIADPS